MRGNNGRRLDRALTLCYKVFMKIIQDNFLMIAASFFLLAVNWLAFHDFREDHTVRDWLMLFASVLVFTQFAREFWKRNLGAR